MSNQITAVVLTKDEERNIGTCLSSLDWVDDLVVVDSGSSDRTIDIAQKHGARVFTNTPERFLIAEQRNWALDNTEIKTEWVLFLDADEIITKDLRDSLLEKISGAQEGTRGFRLCFKFMFLGKWLKHTVNFPTWHDRVLRRGLLRFTGGVWERFEIEEGIEKIHEPYLHLGFNNGVEAWINRHQRYALWKAEKIFSNESSGLEGFGSRFGIFSPLIRFSYHYFVRTGFLDGWAGLVYSLMMAYYQFMIFLYLLEIKRRSKGLQF